MNIFSRLFLPKQNVFFGLLKDISEKQKEIALLLQHMEKDFKNFPEYSKKAKDLEHEADMKAHEVINLLNKTFITPLDREDLYLLAHSLDEIIDLIENLIHNFELYEVEKKHPAFVEFSKLIGEASKALDNLVNYLEHQKYSDELLRLKILVHDIEDKGDKVFQESIHDLFKNEKDPIAVIKYKDLLENFEVILDKYQSVSDVIEGIVVKSS